MKIKTSELTGAALDWAVAKCEGVVSDDIDDFCLSVEGEFDYSTNWAQGGPIIDVNDISQGSARNKKEYVAWLGCASDFGMVKMFFGDTKLIAAMRCYVASKLGDEVEIPEELS